MLQDYLAYGLEADTLVRSTKTALVVGTILAVLNHYANLLAWSVTPGEWAQIALTYVVPFSVATYGQVSGKRQRAREGRQAPTVG